jgi:V/A-type H+-transporting ATPase subunit E
MSLNKVVEEILRRGKEREREIIQMGEKERDELLLQADKKILEEGAKVKKKNAAAIAQMEQQELSSAELESKKIMLAAQRISMEELRQRVLDELGEYPADRRKKLYAKLVARAKKEFGECIVYSNKADRALLQLPSGMSVGSSIECLGGLVFENKDKSIRLDFRFESMVEEAWNRNMREIFTRLFG